MTQFNDLADRVEKASGPDRELDVAIADAMAVSAGWEELFSDVCAPPFTASLDAAMSLVPEGWHWCVATHPEGAFAVVAGEGRDAKSALKVATPALALTAASLRSRGDRNG